jgi:hypothetical protein
MNHINDDKLLAYALEVSDSDAEHANIAAHLSDCAECRAQLEEIRKDIEVIGSVRPSRQLLEIPDRTQRHVTMPSILRIAALLIFGFVVGYGSSNLFFQEPVSVIPSYHTLSPPSDPLRGYAVSDATDISVRYNEHALKGGE